MRWVKRGFWLAAWSFWLCLGFGLYRELPRDLGPVVCKLAFDEFETPLGFIHGERLVVTVCEKPNEAPRLSTWDLTIGKAQRHSPFESPGFKTSLRHAVAFGVLDKAKTDSPELIKMMDLRTGNEFEIGPSTWRLLAIHPVKPLAVFAKPTANAMAQQLVVLDLRSRVPILEWKNEPLTSINRSMIRECQFVDDTDALLILRIRFDSTTKNGHREELLLHRTEIGTSQVPNSRPEAHFCLPVLGGRLGVHYWKEGERQADVIELPSGRTVFTSVDSPHLAAYQTRPEWNATPRLEGRGRTLFSDRWNLWSVDEGRPIWAPSEIDEWVKDGSGSWFVVSENWKPFLNSFGFSSDLRTSAVRDDETGVLKYRRWNGPELACINVDGDLAIFDDGTVRSMPPLVNYPLLALCQAILALPLVMLWAALRWRRQRTMRMASVAP